MTWEEWLIWIGIGVVLWLCGRSNAKITRKNEDDEPPTFV